jgi:histidinol-phosphate aminotransferase
MADDVRPPAAGRPPAMLAGSGAHQTAVSVPLVAPRPEVRAMVGYHSPQVPCSIRLNTNESPFAAPSGWQEALADEVASIDFRRYPDRSAATLRRTIAEHHGVSASQVFAANGSNEVLQTICLTYGGTGRRALVFEPTYAMHGQIARTTGADVVTGPRSADLTIDPDTAADLVRSTDPSIVFICSPNNPTGLIEPRSVIDAVVASSTGVVVIDEAYGQFAEWSAQELIDESSRVCVVRTYSKTWAMAGSRLGYLLAPSWMVDDLEKVVLPYHLDSVKQAAGRLALRYESEMRARVLELVGERQRIIGGLRRLPVTVWPSQANFVLFRPLHQRADDIWAALVERDVLVRNCSGWPGLDNCLRVTVGTAAENAAFLAALNAVIHADSAAMVSR